MPKKKLRFETSYNEEEVDPIYNEILAKSVPINGLSIEPAKGLGGRQIAPIAYLDLEKRPDIRDLGRVHKMDGEGIAASRWGIFKRGAVVEICLELRFKEPAECEFALLFPIDSSFSPVQAWLDYADEQQFMGIVNGEDPSDPRSLESGVFFQLSGQRLLYVIKKLADDLERMG